MDTQATLINLDGLEHVARKRSASDRIGRCQHHGGFLWRGAARQPACPVCGSGLAATTSSLRSGFTVLTDEVLDVCERYPGGIAASAEWHRCVRRNRIAQAAGELDRAERVEFAAEDNVGRRELVGDRIAFRCHGILNVDGLLRFADLELPKVAKLERRLAKLGGELEAPRA